MAKITDIFRSNINALVKKLENPSYLLDLKLDDAKEELKKIQQELGKIKVNKIKEQMAEYAGLAEMAVQKGNDDDALKCIKKKNDLSQDLENAQQLYEAAIQNSKTIENIYHQLEDRIKTMSNETSMIKSQISIAKTQEKLNEISSSANNSSGILSEFDSIKSEAQKRLDAANAIASLNKDASVDELAELKNKYGNPGQNTKNEVDELAELKAKLGK